MKKNIFLFTSILLTLLLASCSSLNSDHWQSYQNHQLGISFEHPESWLIREVNGVITLAIDQEALDNDLTTGAGAKIMLATAGDFDDWNDTGDLLDLFMEYMEMGRENLEKISEPEFITIQDQSLGFVSYRGTAYKQTGLFTAGVITNSEQIALVLAFDGSEDEQHQETLAHFVQSISVYPPSE
jgi:hypothetical protein